MKSKNYGWQKYWTVDLDEHSCSHDSGLAIDWTDENMLTAPAVVVREQGIWHGKIRGGRAAVDAWLAAQPSIRDPQSKRTRLQRVLREAADAWQRALAGSWRADRARMHPGVPARTI